MALSHFIRKPENSWQDLIWPCFLYKAHNIPNNDEFYLVTDTEGNIGIICFWNPIAVTDPELLQKKKKRY
jgi:hypothetical protein